MPHLLVWMLMGFCQTYGNDIQYSFNPFALTKPKLQKVLTFLRATGLNILSSVYVKSERRLEQLI